MKSSSCPANLASGAEWCSRESYAVLVRAAHASKARRVGSRFRGDIRKNRSGPAPVKGDPLVKRLLRSTAHPMRMRLATWRHFPLWEVSYVLATARELHVIFGISGRTCDFHFSQQRREAGTPAELRSPNSSASWFVPPTLRNREGWGSLFRGGARKKAKGGPAARK
jgi:hypothetical protein